jgi:hypothetical protein
VLLYLLVLDTRSQDRRLNTFHRLASFLFREGQVLLKITLENLSILLQQVLNGSDFCLNLSQLVEIDPTDFPESVNLLGNGSFLGVFSWLYIIHKTLHCHLFLQGLQSDFQSVEFLTGLIYDLSDFLSLLHLLPHHLLVLLYNFLLAVCLPELLKGYRMVQQLLAC